MTATASPPQPPTWTLGDRMAKARKVARIGSSEMGERLGVTRTSVGNWESGRHVPSALVLRVWAEETGVPLWWLRGDSTEGDIAGFTAPPTGPTPHTECAGQLILTAA